MSISNSDSKSKPQPPIHNGCIYLSDMESMHSPDFVRTLREFHGLVALGTGGPGHPLFFWEANVIEALFNHATGNIVQDRRAPITQAEIREKRKGKTKTRKYNRKKSGQNLRKGGRK